MAMRKLFDHLGSYNKAYKNWQVETDELDRFVSSLADFLKATKRGDSEETIKGRFDKDVLSHFYKTSLNKDRADLVVEEDGKTAAIFEFKRPGNKNEMVFEDDVNRKSLHEAIWYFYNQDTAQASREIKNIVITDTEKFFFFDPAAFWDDKLRRICESFRSKGLSIANTSDLYDGISDIIRDRKIDFTYAVFDLARYRDEIISGKLCDDDRAALANFYKALHANFMLRHFKQNDSNELDREFYTELLYIVGLTEHTTKGGKRTLAQSNTEGSIFDLIMRELDVGIEDKFEAALQLSIVWLNRVLFLKIFEGRLVSANGGADEYRFFDSSSIKDFNRLNRFFFQVLGKPIADRQSSNSFPLIPYLNSALFEQSEAEKIYDIEIARLDPDAEIIVMHGSVITKSMQNYPAKVPTLKYLLDFLGVHDFRSDVGIGDGKVKTINPSVLGLVFEKLNGYKDGSFYTPGFITEYMARRTIDRAVCGKFSRIFGLEDDKAFETIDEVRYYLHKTAGDMHKPDRRALYTSVIDDLKVCDPACGSGHFLVSVLNYLVYIKYFLGLLTFDDTAISLEIQNDTLVIYDGERQFEYRRGDKRGHEIQRKIFHEKETIIKHCLFGVDINPNSVNICRLRLWIELLKNTYYIGDEEGNMQLLPNIEMNIKIGNSLVSAYEVHVGQKIKVVDDKSDKLTPITDEQIKELKSLTNAYKNAIDRKEKHDIKRRLSEFLNFRAMFHLDNIYGDSIEWMVEFPELLDESNRFCGFDIVIGNPPYGLLNKKQNKHIGIEVMDDLLDHYKTNILYQPAKNGVLNIYRLFVCLAFNILREGGCFSMIFPLAFIGDLSAKMLRRYMLHEYTVNYIEAFPERDNANKRVFESAKMSVCIVGATKSSNEEDTSFPLRINMDRRFAPSDNAAFITNKDIESIDRTTFSIPLLIGDELDVMRKLCASNLRLGDIARCYEGEVHMTFDKKFMTDDPKRARMLRGAQVQKYRITNEISQGEILYLDDAAYLKATSSDRSRHHLSRRIIMQGITGVNERYRLKMTICDQGVFLANSIHYIMPEKDIYYILGLCNSKVLNWFFTKMSTNSNVNSYEVDNLPIVIADKKTRSSVEKLVKRIMSDPDDPDRVGKLDQIIYNIYGLSENDVAVVERHYTQYLAAIDEMVISSTESSL